MSRHLNWSLSERRRTISLDRAESFIGQQLFVTDWRGVDRLHLDQFHWSVDETPEKSDMSANAAFPRGDENIDGFMLLALITSAFFNNYPIGEENVIAWNYGLDRVRFPATVYLNNRIRMLATLTNLVKKDSGVLTTNRVVIEIENQERPALSADFLVMLTSPKYGVVLKEK